ncbi:ImmA/IrrE family metallo-endopeptidase [Rhodovulum marinum]|uniref:ImmA/IrrE family metallo-endopeptidase n=1 Tax=Rhodovulum marinum TaxID=320662 RepID=UPI0010525AEF|nr:ImmA/IrrE family metallo-endopeptidase [Rhodovulum marinum]
MLTLAEKLEIVRRHQTAPIAPPVQTVPIAEDLGLKVYHVQGWPDDLSGKIVRDEVRGGDSGFAIFVNGTHHVNRRRFTTAHECAHFILHEDSIGDGIADDALYRSMLSNKMEAEANRMAADILMPWHLLNREIDAGDTSVESLAHKFQVSPSAMSIRLGVPY